MGKSQSKQSKEPVDMSLIEEVCTAWAQKKYGPKCKVVSVDTKDFKVNEENIHYRESDKKERRSVTRSRKTFPNKTNTSIPREIKDQSAKTYSCAWTRTKGYQVSGDVSVNVGLPAAVGLKLGGKFQHKRSNTRTEISGKDETFEHVTRFEQPPWSTWLTKTVTTQKVVTMPYTQDLRLEGKLTITLQKANRCTGTVCARKTKTSVDMAVLYPEKVETDANGKKSALITNDGTFEVTTEMDQEVTVEEPAPDKLMTLSLIHNDLLRAKREEIEEELKDQRALSKLLEVMSSEKVVSEEQAKTVSQSQSVKEGVDKIVDVLEKAEPEKFLVFVDILQREGYNELAELLDPRWMYPDSVRHISNLSGVVDHYFVTKKESEVRNNLESGRRVIIHGMPGSGKTQLAYKVAGDYARVHPHSVVWVIDGSSKEKLNDGITNLQQRLSGETNVDNNQFKDLVSRWKHFLLLINDLSPTVAIPIEILSSSAKMIVTTQSSLREREDIANIPIEGFTEDEAVAFLSPKMPTGTTEEQMREFANIFSCLPLGLAAARASIHRGNMTVEEYKQQLYAGKEALKLLMKSEDNWLHMHYMKKHQEAARNIFAALQLAIDNLDDPCEQEEERKCKVMLQPCAFLEPNNIPVLMLKSALKSSPATGPDAYFTERMRMYSLGSIEGAGVKRRLSIHGVTQMAIRLHMDKKQQTTCVNKVLQILVKFFVKDMTYSKVHKFSLALMPHVEAALKHADELELGTEYPLLKARLLMVYGHLLVQKGTPRMSKICLKKAEKNLLQFADRISARTKSRASGVRASGVRASGVRASGVRASGVRARRAIPTLIPRAIPYDDIYIPSDEDGPYGALPSGARPSEDEQSVQINSDYQSTSKDLYQSLADKSQSLEDGFFEETVIRRTITKQNLRAVRDKLGAEHSTTRKLENMVENFEPLTMEMYKTLVKSDLAIPVEKLKRIFLPELYISIMFTLSKAILDLAYDDHRTDLCSTVPLALDMCTEVINDTGVPVMVRFLADMYTVEPILLKAVELLILHETKGKDATRSYDFGLLTGVSDTLLTLNYYENVMVSCIQAVKQAEEDKKCRLISFGHDTCKKMLELVESERKAGNPPLGLSQYYMTAGDFYKVAGKLEKADQMFHNAYKVGLEREEYHPRMGDALTCLIYVHIEQEELESARDWAEQYLQLAKEHWPEQEPLAEEELRKVRSMISTETENETTV